MVDSSIGGKTAVDYGSLKNMVGTFYQPRLVVADVDTLKTLPQIELSNGLSEVIKAAAIRDKTFFDFLQERMPGAMALNTDVLETIVEKCAHIKAQVVEADEKESGLRTIMNFGHTVGHTVEALSDFKIKHGQAVAFGMMVAAKISVRLGFLSEDDMKHLGDLILAANLHVDLPDMDQIEKEKLLELIKHDKKVLDGKIRFVLLKAVGEAFISDNVTSEIIQEVLFGSQSA
jgi:3-dehydroquinate synthase